MSSKLQNQSAKVWQLVTKPETANAYKETVFITWQILRESAILIWLVFCLVLVVGDWFWTNSIFAGRRFRVWVDNLDTQDSTLASDAGQKFLTASKASLLNTISQAREQLGLPEKKESALAIPETSAKEPVPAVTVPASPEPPVVKHPEADFHLSQQPSTPPSAVKPVPETNSTPDSEPEP